MLMVDAKRSYYHAREVSLSFQYSPFFREKESGPGGGGGGGGGVGGRYSLK